MGAVGNDGTGTNAGHVRVYQWSGSSWTQMGPDIDGEATTTSGHSVSLSSDGAILAIGATHNAGVNGQNSGHVRVYQWSNGSWDQMGSDIDGES